MDIPTFSSRISPNYGVILKRTKEQAKDFNLWLDRMKLEGYKLEPEEVTLSHQRHRKGTSPLKTKMKTPKLQTEAIRTSKTPRKTKSTPYLTP